MRGLITVLGHTLYETARILHITGTRHATLSCHVALPPRTTPTHSRMQPAHGSQSTQSKKSRRSHASIVGSAASTPIISTSAALQLMVTLRNAKVLEHFNDFADSHVKQAGTNYPEVVDGYFTVPDRPGWGVELDEEFIKDHPPVMIDGVAQDPGLNMFEDAGWNKRGQGE